MRHPSRHRTLPAHHARPDHSHASLQSGLMPRASTRRFEPECSSKGGQTLARLDCMAVASSLLSRSLHLTASTGTAAGTLRVLLHSDTARSFCILQSS